MTPPIDLPFLDAQTFGDKGLQRELLALFVEQATAVAARLAEPGDLAADLHTLKGSASAIGAAGLAAEAAHVEHSRRERPTSPLPVDLGRLRDAIAEVCSFAATLIAKA